MEVALKVSNSHPRDTVPVESDTPWPYMILVELTPYLTKLKSLSMSGHTTSYASLKCHLPLGDDLEPILPAQFMGALLQHASTLQSLHLSIVEFATFESFTTFILSFPQLRILTLADVDFETYDHPKATDTVCSFRSFPPLEELTVSMTETGAAVMIYEWILRTRLYARLSTLQLESVDCSPSSQHAIAAGNLIRACGPSLRNLSLEISNVLKLGRDGFFAFDSNTSLCCLAIKQKCTGLKDAKRTKRLHWLISLLSTVPNDNKLQIVNVTVRMPYNPHGTKDASLKPHSKLENDFSQLDALFAGDSFRSARRITYGVSVVNWSWKVEWNWKDGCIASGSGISTSALFPLSEARGIFQFETVPMSNEGPKWDFGDPEPDSEDDV